MIETFQLTLLVLLFSVPIYHLLPSNLHRLRQGYLLVLSLALLFNLAPFSVLSLLQSLALAAGIFAWKRRNRLRKSLLDYLIFVPWVVLSLYGSELYAVWPNLEGNMWRNPLDLGLSFYTLKLFGSLRASGPVTFWDVATSAAFFGNLPSGPIEYAAAFSRDRTERELTSAALLDAAFRIGLGGVKVFVIAAFLQQLMRRTGIGGNWAGANATVAWFWVYLHFLNLYFNFSGFSDIAIGIGRLFGIRIRENFRMPLLARNIQEFWQRWHLSLGGFISLYMFLPAVRKTGKPTLSIFATFVLVGLWHRITPNYLVWGVCHGAGLAAFMYVQGDIRKQDRPWRARDAISIAATVTFVSIASAFANQPSLKSGARMLLALIGV